MRVRIIQPTTKDEQKRLKVCAYVRVSTDNYKQGESLENQTLHYENLLTANAKYDFVGVFTDKGITGTTDNRPEFQRMINLCHEGKIDIIFTKSISRFARNTAIVLQTVRELKDIGVEIRFERENINTLSGDGELMLTILSSIAEEESRSMSENLKWRVKKKFENGQLIINTKRFLGYDKDEYSNLIINQDEARIVKRIYSEYLSGNGTFRIAKMLNLENVPTVTGAKWNESTVLEILKNEKYKGDVIQQKTYSSDYLRKQKKKNKGEKDSFYITDNHSPIILKEEWDQVQAEIRKRAERKGISKGSDKYKNRYPLTGLLFCSKCGAVLRRRTWNSKLSCKKIVWQCSNYIENGKKAWEAVQLELERRRAFIEKYNIGKLDYANPGNPFSGRVICGCCGSSFGRKVWNSTDERLRRIIWRCNKKYAVKGKKLCDNGHIDDEFLYRAFVIVFNGIIENKDYFMGKWRELLSNEDVLKKVTAKKFIEIFKTAKPIERFNEELYLKLIEKIVVNEGALIVVLLDGSEIEMTL